MPATETTEKKEEHQAGKADGTAQAGAPGTKAETPPAPPTPQAQQEEGVFANVRRLLGRKSRGKDLAAEVEALRKDLAAVKQERDEYRAQLEAVDKALEGFAFTDPDAAGPVGAKIEQVASDRTAQHLRALSVPIAQAPATTPGKKDEEEDFESAYEASKANGGTEHAKFVDRHRAQVRELLRKRASRN